MLFSTNWTGKRSHAHINVGVNFGLRSAAEPPGREWPRFWARQSVFTQKLTTTIAGYLLVESTKPQIRVRLAAFVIGRPAVARVLPCSLPDQ